MPRIKREVELEVKPKFSSLVEQLADELRNNRAYGQPVIEEMRLPRTDALRVTVIWDNWEGVPFEDRSNTILQAYEDVEGRGFRERIVLATAFTFPEAYEVGMLPYQVLPLVRKDDPVSVEKCVEAMVEEGASLLFAPDEPQLRFAKREEAEACVKRLVKRLPKSEPVWAITRDVGRIEPRALD
ncbi:MAG TPA: hypothetical protein VMV10_13630 [Pirellulales bacterium]|nr:hypothetical protein [Pirellulales bacterium]